MQPLALEANRQTASRKGDLTLLCHKLLLTGGQPAMAMGELRS